jgi:coatomer subunit beta
MNNFKFLIYNLKMVEKVNPNGELKQEMILVCNSIRNDLLHPNEYIRGRTLRMLMRVMHIGILEPLKPSILENITHTCAYVRRNCVALLYKIYLKFNGIKFEIFFIFTDDLTPDIDVNMETLLQKESDLSTKRNAFLLLFTANQEKALNYIQSQLSDFSNDMGDVMQLIILELLKK